MPNDMSAAYEGLCAANLTHPGVTAGQMFGKPCLKLNGKAFAARQGDLIAFKLTGLDHAAALAEPGAALWDPSGKGRPMREWVALRVSSQASFPALATAAMLFVGASA